MTEINIELHLRFLKNTIDPDITVSVDNKILLSGPQSHDKFVLKYQDILNSGPHQLSINCHNMTKSNADDDMAVVIDRVCFQNVDYDFSTYSSYFPDYPIHWTEQKILNGKTPVRKIHSNYLGWNGLWCINFSVPIYRWIHQRMNLGWLI